MSCVQKHKAEDFDVIEKIFPSLHLEMSPLHFFDYMVHLTITWIERLVFVGQCIIKGCILLKGNIQHHFSVFLFPLW